MHVDLYSIQFKGKKGASLICKNNHVLLQVFSKD